MLSPHQDKLLRKVKGSYPEWHKAVLIPYQNLHNYNSLFRLGYVERRYPNPEYPAPEFRYIPR